MGFRSHRGEQHNDNRQGGDSMASERPEGSGSMGDNWAPSPELLEERELLSGLLAGLSDLAAGAPVEEAAVGPDPGAEEPPAVVVPPPEMSASGVAAQAPASVLASHAADSSIKAWTTSSAAPGASVSVVATVSTIGAPAGSEATPASSTGAATAPGAEAIDSLLAKVAVENESHADSTAVNSARATAGEPGALVEGSTATHAADSRADQAHAATAESEARVGADVAAARATGPASALKAHAVNAPAAGAISAHDAGMAESRVDGKVNTAPEFEVAPTAEEAAQPHILAEVSSGRRQEDAVEQEMPTFEDNQSEEAKAPIERSLLPSAGDHKASDTNWVDAEDAEHETSETLQAGAVRIVEQVESGEGLVSRVSQFFDGVPNWPGVDLDAFEDAARTQVKDSAQFGMDLDDMVSTQSVSILVTATIGTAVGFGIARRELGLQARNADDGPTNGETELCWSFT
jgi:hypothetical protein